MLALTREQARVKTAIAYLILVRRGEIHVVNAGGNGAPWTLALGGTPRPGSWRSPMDALSTDWAS